MTGGGRRRPNQVIARPIIRAIAVAVMLLAVGNLLLLGCVWRWLALDGLDTPEWWFTGTCALCGVVGGVAATAAWMWSR